MRQQYPALFRSLFQSDILLAELGIVAPDILRRSVDQYLTHGGEFLRVALFHSLKTELWLRGLSRSGAVESHAPVAHDARSGTKAVSPVLRNGAAVCAGQSPVFH